MPQYRINFKNKTKYEVALAIHGISGQPMDKLMCYGKRDLVKMYNELYDSYLLSWRDD